MLKPKILTTLKDYSIPQLRSDILAGVIVGIIALPLAIAFATASGVTPDRGLVTAVVAGFLISLLGGSRVQIGGPTGAFIIIIYGIVQKFGVEGLITATLMAGIILIFMGFAHFGGVIKFIPYPVTIGFTSGIAVLIFTAQIKDFLGLTATLPGDFLEKIIALSHGMNHWNPDAVLCGAVTIVIIFAWEKISKKIPGSLFALGLTTALVAGLNLPVETIGTTFGAMPESFPLPQWPHLTWHAAQTLLPSAFSIAILAGIEALLSAVIADGMIGGKHRSDMELIAQGAANIGAALFGGVPATGAIARTAANVHNGGRTPIAGIVHALTVLAMMLILGRWTTAIPLPCLAGILMVVAFRMAEWHSFRMILKAPRSDLIVLLMTFSLTIFVDLTVAIQAGIVLAAFLLIRRMALTANIAVITREFIDEEERHDPLAISKRSVPEGVEVFEISGPFFFGVTSTFLEVMKNLERKPLVRILRMRHVLSIDATALNALRQVHRESKANHITLLLSGVHAQPLIALEKSRLLQEIGPDNVLPNIDTALSRARELLAIPAEPPSVKKMARGHSEQERTSCSEAG